jgi:serine/threonine protein kinase
MITINLFPVLCCSDLMLVRVLGRGGQKSVSLCRHRPSGALVVRCTIADNIALTQNPALIHRLKDEFHSEMATLCQLKHHRNIVKLLAVVSDAFEANALAAQRPGQGNIGQFPGFGGPRVNDINMLKQYEKADTKASIQSETLSFILEYCSNGSLRDVMNSEIVEFNMLLRVRIAKALARSVLFLHSLPMPIIHGDLKPGNCLLTRDFTVRLCDFGLSKTQAQTSGLMVTTRSVAGTSNYMAPEQFTQAQNKLSYKVDVWAFGCLLIELFHPQHKVPYGEFHTNAVPYQVAEGNMPPELDSVEPVELRALIRDKCLVKDADRRATMKEVLESLRTLFPNSTYPDEPNAEVPLDECLVNCLVDVFSIVEFASAGGYDQHCRASQAR